MYVIHDKKILGFCREKNIQKVKEYFLNKYGWTVDFFMYDEAWMTDDFSYQGEIDKIENE